MKPKKCRDKNCKHGGSIDLEHDDYIKVGKTKYYHRDCTAKCCYKNCKHPDIDIELSKEDTYVLVENDEGIKHVYHEDCYKEQKAIDEIIDLWHRYKELEPDEYGTLQYVIRGMLNKGYDIEYILFATKNKITHLNHPPGMWRAVSNYRVKEAYKLWKKAQENKANEEETENPVKIEPQKVEHPKFQATTQKKYGFADIFGGG